MQVEDALYSRVDPTPTGTEPYLVAYSREVAGLLDLGLVTPTVLPSASTLSWMLEATRPITGPGGGAVVRVVRMAVVSAVVSGGPAMVG